jgi:hypothetical protein
MTDDLQHSQLHFTSSRDGQSVNAFTASSDTSSISSNWSAVQQLSECGIDDDKMATILGNDQPADIFCGLEETAVDSDDDDLCSVNTEVYFVHIAEEH